MSNDKPVADRIWLQPGAGVDGETTWCRDKINDDDIEYVRAALSSQPVADREKFIAWHTGRYGYAPILDREGIPADEFPDQGAMRWEVWQAALSSQQPVAATGDDCPVCGYPAHTSTNDHGTEYRGCESCSIWLHPSDWKRLTSRQTAEFTEVDVLAAISAGITGGKVLTFEAADLSLRFSALEIFDAIRAAQRTAQADGGMDVKDENAS